jgi:N-acetylmuramoyl-L-alanine amidase
MIKKILALLAFFASCIVWDNGSAEELDYGRTCLALAAYSEARSDGDAGMLAVMRVVLNRATDHMGRFPVTICDVVEQPGQFAGVFGWPMPRLPHEKAVYERALALTDDALAGTGLPAGCSHALYFHKTDATTSPLAGGCMIGKHIFY